jgi:ubiquinone biosynthesis protein COQ9
MSATLDELRQKFLVEALKELPFGDWDEQLCFKVEEKLNLKKHQHALLYPKGLNDLVDQYEQYLGELMISSLKALPKSKITKIREKIKYAIMLRLDNNITNNRLIHGKTMQFYRKLNNIPDGLKHSWRTVDQIWKYAGDTSTDYNYYTKRTLLFGVYNAAFIYYLNDDSKEHLKTWEFVECRINDVLRIGSFKKHLNLSTLCDNIPFIRQFKR